MAGSHSSQDARSARLTLFHKVVHGTVRLNEMIISPRDIPKPDQARVTRSGRFRQQPQSTATHSSLEKSQKLNLLPKTVTNECRDYCSILGLVWIHYEGIISA